VVALFFQVLIHVLLRKMDHEDNVATCSVCLEPTEQRGGKPLYSAGCCGNWLHLECAYAMAKSVSCNTSCPHCRARVVLPQALDMQKINGITRRLRHDLEAVEALLNPGASPRVVTPPRAARAAFAPSRTSIPVPVRLSNPTSVPAPATVPIPVPPPTAPSRAAPLVAAPSRTAVPTPVPPEITSPAPVPPRTLLPVSLPPTTFVQDPGPPSASLPVPASARASQPTPLPPRTYPPDVTAYQEYQAQVASEDDGIYDMWNELRSASAHARPAATTLSADVSARGVRYSHPIGMSRYISRVLPYSEFDIERETLQVLRGAEERRHVTDSVLSGLHYDYSVPATWTATDTQSLADSDTHAAHARRSLQPPPPYWPAGSTAQRLSRAELSSLSTEEREQQIEYHMRMLEYVREERLLREARRLREGRYY
jgi:hypothetical protein